MRANYRGKRIDVFTISPRTVDHKEYWENIQNVINWSEKYACTGVLIFTGNDTYVDPWLVAHSVLTRSRTLEPLIAVNPIYMHPFTAAKMISSFAYLYQRKVWLNLVTGAALTYLDVFYDNLSHDDRYERLLEYALLIDDLLAGDGLTCFDGRFYKVTDLQVVPKMPESLRPGYFLAGQSDAARGAASRLNACSMQMLQPGLQNQLNGARGIHFGIITRATQDQAWDAAHGWFPEDEEGQMMLDLSMQNTDSVWKRRMKLLSEDDKLHSNGYWLRPFRDFKADCPYLVGAHSEVADVIAQLIIHGVDTFILDLPANEQEFEHAHAAFRLAEQRLIASMALPIA
jgi:alkanesulfonate monooxygenase